VLLFTLTLAITTGFLAGILPAFRLTRTNVNDALKQAWAKPILTPAAAAPAASWSLAKSPYH
jgi:hypothetical protein